MEPTKTKKTTTSTILITFLALGVVFALGYNGFGWKNYFRSSEIPNIINSFTSTADTDTNLETDEAWQVFENYLEFARAHNLDGVKSLSYQISATCQDLAREAECLTLMDSVYAFGNALKKEDFSHVNYDNRQVILFTDAPNVAILYFTRDEKGVLKILGLRFCFEDENAPGSCARNVARDDTDGDGWWDSTESLFY